jgi:outer membrane lipoprotein-sorting protein
MKMKIWGRVLLLVVAVAARAQAAGSAPAGKTATQTTPAAGEKKPAQPAVTPAGPEDLQHLLAQMNTASKGFSSAQADFQWDSFQMVVQETTVQKGKMFLRRTSKGMDAALHVTSPDPTQVVFKNCELSFYQPKIEQVTQRNACENRADVESFMSLGFGASGDDLTRKYTVTLEGWENVQGVKTAKLNLVPKDEKVKSSLSKVILWIDPARSLAVQQKFMEPSGDYRLAKYSNIRVNSKISDDEFKLKTTSKTKFVKP